MRKSHPSSLDSLIAETRFSRLQGRASELSKVNQMVQAWLEQQGIQHTRVANFRDGMLMLETGSPAWLMRLNYTRAQLMSHLRQTYPTLISVEIKVNPSLMDLAPEETIAAKKAKPNPRTVSPAAAEHLRRAAENAPDSLKEKLERIAALAEKKRQE